MRRLRYVESAVIGGSVLLSLYGSEWEWKARQLAVERDADLSLIRACDGEGSFGFLKFFRRRAKLAELVNGRSLAFR